MRIFDAQKANIGILRCILRILMMIELANQRAHEPCIPCSDKAIKLGIALPAHVSLPYIIHPQINVD